MGVEPDDEPVFRVEQGRDFGVENSARQKQAMEWLWILEGRGPPKRRSFEPAQAVQDGHVFVDESPVPGAREPVDALARVGREAQHVNGGC